MICNRSYQTRARRRSTPLPRVIAMRAGPRFAVPLFLLCFSLSPSAAQTAGLEAGDRVRLSAPLFRGTAVVTGQNADEVTLSVENSGAPLVVPWSSITELAVRQRRSTGEGALYGAKWGLGVGAAVGLLMLVTPADPEEEWSETALAIAAVVEGVGIGALIGALRPGSHWRSLGVSTARDAARLAPASGNVPVPVPVREARRFPREGKTPALEMTLGVGGPELPHAQFPGVSASLALNRGWRSDLGAALAAEMDLISYLQRGVMVGPRIYGRTAPLFGEHGSMTYFGQLLVGQVASEESGVIRSKGGSGIQPGVGVDWGGGHRALRVQLSYRIVPGGVVEDSRLDPPEIARLSGPRGLVGFTWRVGSW